MVWVSALESESKAIFAMLASCQFVSRCSDFSQQTSAKISATLSSAAGLPQERFAAHNPISGIS